MHKYNECNDVLAKFDSGNHEYFSQVKALEFSKEKAFESKDLKAMAQITKNQISLVNNFKSSLFSKFKQNLNFETEFNKFKSFSEEFNFSIEKFQYKSIVMAYNLYGFEMGYTKYCENMKNFKYQVLSFEKFSEFMDVYFKFDVFLKFEFYQEAAKLNKFSSLDFEKFENVLNISTLFGHYELKSKEFYNSYFNYCETNKIKTVNYEEYYNVVKFNNYEKFEIGFERYFAIASKLKFKVMDFELYKNCFKSTEFFMKEKAFFMFKEFLSDNKLNNKFKFSQKEFDFMFNSFFFFGSKVGFNKYFENSEKSNFKSISKEFYFEFFKQFSSINFKEFYEEYSFRYESFNYFYVSYENFKQAFNYYLKFDSKFSYANFFKFEFDNFNKKFSNFEFISFSVDYLLNYLSSISEELNTQFSSYNYLLSYNKETHFFFDVSYSYYKYLSKEQDNFLLSEDNYYSMTSLFRSFYKENNFSFSHFLSFEEFKNMNFESNFNFFNESQFLEFTSLVKNNYNFEEYFNSALSEVYFGPNFEAGQEFSATHGLLDSFTSYLSKFNDKILEFENLFTNVADEFEKEKKFVKAAVTPYCVCPDYY
jgi:hypothetical protein